MAPLLVTNVEYILLRLVRRFLLPKDLHHPGRYLLKAAGFDVQILHQEEDAAEFARIRPEPKAPA